VEVLSIQVSKPKTVQYRGNPVTTGIFKEPITGPVMLRKLNLDGDGQADLRVHGGPDKALYAYSNDAYPDWRLIRPQDIFPFGAMGENLSIARLREESIYVGDTYKIGDAVVQVTQPRFPCQKLAVKFNDPKILKQFMKLARPGVYFRVVTEGPINVGDKLHRLEQDPVLLSIAEFFMMVRDSHADPKRLQEVLKIKALPVQWHQEFTSWLNDA
jgi:MOSC domain-containing protein YiiM